jgi:choline kinase
MKVIIIAAGYNDRFKGAIDVPKTLLKVGPTTILERQINSLTKAGLKKEDIFVVVGYKKEMIEAIHSNVIHNDKFIEFDNAYSVYLALDRLCRTIPEGSKETILIIDGDLVYDEILIKEILSFDKDNIIVTKEIESSADQKDEIILINSESKIVEMVVPKRGRLLNKKYKGRRLYGYIGILKLSQDQAITLKDKLNQAEILKSWYTIPLVDMVKNNNFYNLIIPKNMKFCFDIDDIKDFDKLMNLDMGEWYEE